MHFGVQSGRAEFMNNFHFASSSMVRKIPMDTASIVANLCSLFL
mgnify:CR=1 FL=1